MASALLNLSQPFPRTLGDFREPSPPIPAPIAGSGAPAWKRLQAARALEWYQSLVLAQSLVDFAPFKLKPAELANVEKRAGESLNNHEVKKKSASFLPILRLLVKLPPGHKIKLYVH